jgi:hypothetical protein
MKNHDSSSFNSSQSAFRAGKELLKNLDQRKSVNDGLHCLRVAVGQGHAEAASTMANFYAKHPAFNVHGGYARQACAFIAHVGGEADQLRHLNTLKDAELPELRKTVKFFYEPALKNFPEDSSKFIAWDEEVWSEDDRA